MTMYKKFMRLCDIWTKDPSRKKDLGLFIERKVAKAFSKGENSTVDAKECSEMYEALERIANDSAMKKYPLDDNVKLSVSGLDLEGCHALNSTQREEEYREKLSTKVNEMLPSFLRRGYIPKKD
ncbi:ubiquinol-cytochrome-c reductase complex assembly factor 2-like [Ostrea edulis]|uniref:ubiquinol-cytochrome-c reductase complex assembly factor 2-like n=1 Tax=Ostrea edulis TaxID=37623 RepID=UPI002095EB36|nr:ubiquinol-cytochrome-c reductase complex assembly factor 2-like [Ostrea edulis]